MKYERGKTDTKFELIRFFLCASSYAFISRTKANIAQITRKQMTECF